MNAERFHAIVLSLREDLRQTNCVALTKQLFEALDRQVGQPQDPSHQQQVSNTRQELVDKLKAAPSNDYSPTWRQTLEELDLVALLGSELSAAVEEIFNRNQITPATAKEEVEQLHQDLQNLDSAINRLVSGFEYMEIGSEQLEPGECELGMLIPRDAVENELPNLADELHTMQKIFNPFSELISSTRSSFHVKTIATTDFSVFIEMTPQIAACIALAVERTVALYKQLLEIRKLRGELKEQGVGDESLSGVDEYSNQHMRNGIAEIAGSLVNEYEVNENRKNELETELRMVLNQLANRIDRGYNIDVRGEEPETDQSDDDEDGIPNPDSQYFVAIRDSSSGLRFINLSGEPILSLPEPPEQGNGG